MSFLVIIRNTTKEDYLPVKGFFLNNQSKYNLARSDQVLFERIGRSKFVTIAERNLGIVGVSGTFEYGADGEFREAGATRIILNGFQFQRALHYARSLHEFILDYSYSNYFATVVNSNTKSIRNLECVGFEKWDPPNPDLVAEKSASSDPSRVVAYYQLLNEKLPEHAKALLSLESNPILRRPDRKHPGSFEEVTISFDLEILNEHHPVVEQISSGNVDIHQQ